MPKGEKKQKKLSKILLPIDQRTLSTWLGLCANKVKFLLEPSSPVVEVDLPIVKDDCISCYPNDPACGDEDFSENWASKGCSGINNHI